MSRIASLVLLLGMLAPAPGLASDGMINDGVHVAVAADLSRDARTAARTGAVILLEFYADDCPYCALLEEEFLKPMLRSGDYDETVIMRAVDIDRARPLTDFQGRRSTSAALADRFGVDLTPTVVLVDSRGRPLGKRIVGIWSLDFYGGLLDDRIDAALAQVRRARTHAGGAWETESR